MYSHAFPDPDYTSDPASYLRDTVQALTKYTVVADAALTRSMLEIDDATQEIRIRKGEAFRIFHALMGRATLYVVGGASWAPEFRTKARLHVVPPVPSCKLPKQATPSDIECPQCHHVVAGGGVG